MTGEIDLLCSALGLSPHPAQTQALMRFVDLLLHWNATYNLTAVRERSAILTHHLADCLAAIQPMARELPRGRVLDVGSGGGLPGVVLAIMLPSLEVTCVDAVGKKAAFVRQVAGTLQLRNLAAAHARIESLVEAPFDLITSRAFASLADFTQLSRPLLAPSGSWMAMKGKHPDAEIEVLPSDIDVFHVEPLTVPGLSAERCLVWMRPASQPAQSAPPAPTTS